MSLSAYEEHEDHTFTTVYKPNLMFEDAGMKIRLDSDGHSYGPKITVDVATVSPKPAYADIFDGYGKIIQDFYSTLERGVEDPDAPLSERELRSTTKTWHGRWSLAVLGLVIFS